MRASIFILALFSLSAFASEPTLYDRLEDDKAYKSIGSTEHCPKRIRIEKSPLLPELKLKIDGDFQTKSPADRLHEFEFKNINEGKKSEKQDKVEKSMGIKSKLSTITKSDAESISSLTTFVSKDTTGELLSYKISTVLQMQGEEIQIRYKKEHTVLQPEESFCVYRPTETP